MFDAPRPSFHSLLQDPAFAGALRLCGQRPVLLPGGLMLLRRRFFGVPVLMLPRATPPPDLTVQLVAAGLQHLPLILSPERAGKIPGALRLSGPRPLARLPLTGSLAQRRAALHPKWRNQLRRAEASRLEISCAPLPADPDHPLLRREAAQARARGYASWPAPLTAAFAKCAPAQTHLFCARRQGQDIAQMLFLSHGARASYHIGFINAAGKAHCAHNLLLWQAAGALAARGITEMDLGPLHPRTAGLNRFKLRSGARAVETGGSWLRWRPF